MHFFELPKHWRRAPASEVTSMLRYYNIFKRADDGVASYFAKAVGYQRIYERALVGNGWESGICGFITFWIFRIGGKALTL